jgi:serine/threonine protein kinase
MLQALDCIAWKGIVHRDVKPENILYISQGDGQYQFQLGDFGLGNRIIDAVTFAGTYLYMPPEILKEGNQTHKVDVWSLFVTILWILDAGEFRQRSNKFKTIAEVQRTVLSAASNVGTVSKIREMAIVNPEERASAAQMLVKHFDGAGLSTPRNQVSALTSNPPPTIATAKARPLNPAAPYRVEKARGPFQNPSVGYKRLAQKPQAGMMSGK